MKERTSGTWVLRFAKVESYSSSAPGGPIGCPKENRKGIKGCGPSSALAPDGLWYWAVVNNLFVTVFPIKKSQFNLLIYWGCNDNVK